MVSEFLLLSQHCTSVSAQALVSQCFLSEDTVSLPCVDEVSFVRGKMDSSTPLVFTFITNKDFRKTLKLCYLLSSISPTRYIIIPHYGVSAVEVWYLWLTG